MPIPERVNFRGISAWADSRGVEFSERVSSGWVDFRTGSIFGVGQVSELANAGVGQFFSELVNFRSVWVALRNDLKELGGR